MTTKLVERGVNRKGRSCKKKKVHVEVYCQSHYLVITRSLLNDLSLLWTPAPLTHCATRPKFLHQRVFSKGVRHFHVIYSTKLQTVERHEMFLCFPISSMLSVTCEVGSKHLVISYSSCNIFNLEMQLIYSYLVGPGIQVSWLIAHHKVYSLWDIFQHWNWDVAPRQILSLLICDNGEWWWQEHCIGKQQIYFRVAAVPLTSWVLMTLCSDGGEGEWLIPAVLKIQMYGITFLWLQFNRYSLI